MDDSGTPRVKHRCSHQDLRLQEGGVSPFVVEDRRLNSTGVDQADP